MMATHDPQESPCASSNVDLVLRAPSRREALGGCSTGVRTGDHPEAHRTAILGVADAKPSKVAEGESRSLMGPACRLGGKSEACCAAVNGLNP